jgi:hypothetical protein
MNKTVWYKIAMDPFCLLKERLSHYAFGQIYRGVLSIKSNPSLTHDKVTKYCKLYVVIIPNNFIKKWKDLV